MISGEIRLEILFTCPSEEPDQLDLSQKFEQFAQNFLRDSKDSIEIMDLSCEWSSKFDKEIGELLLLAKPNFKALHFSVEVKLSPIFEATAITNDNPGDKITMSE